MENLIRKELKYHPIQCDQRNTSSENRKHITLSEMVWHKKKTFLKQTAGTVVALSVKEVVGGWKSKVRLIKALFKFPFDA